MEKATDKLQCYEGRNIIVSSSIRYIMTPELLAEYMGRHKREISGRYQRLHDAYENKYAIDFLPPKPDWKPDNRIPVNFAKYITDTMNGFFIGIPIKTTSDDKRVDEYLEFLDQYNDQDDNNAELSKICSIYGSGYEMYFVDETGNIGITYLTPMDAFMITMTASWSGPYVLRTALHRRRQCGTGKLVGWQGGPAFCQPGKLCMGRRAQGAWL